MQNQEIKIHSLFSESGTGKVSWCHVFEKFVSFWLNVASTFCKMQGFRDLVPVPKIYSWWWDVQELRETSRVCTAVKDERTKKPF